MAPGRDASAVLFFGGLYSHAERAMVRVVTIDCPLPSCGPGAVPQRRNLADAFHLHRRVLAALTEVRRDAWNRGATAAAAWASPSRTPASPWPGR
jgi:transposase